MRKIVLKEIIKEVPEVQTVILPNHWFEVLNDAQTIFISLYDWMLKEGGVPSNSKSTLHSRTYVGEKLYRKLVSAEKKRLRKKYKLKGEKLSEAVVWSDINSGPKYEIAGFGIAGDTILVVPESSQQALSEFSTKIYNKQRDAAIKKSRNNAAGATFYQWLISQINRPDRVGDCARDAAVDNEFPQGSNDHEEIISYLDIVGACSAAIESFSEGWLEYIQQYPDRIEPYAVCSQCGKKIYSEDALLAYGYESSELLIIDSECLNIYGESEQIITYPLSTITESYLDELIERHDISKLEIENIKTKLKVWGLFISSEEEGYVYFIKSAKTQAIKIGFTSGDVGNRLRSLQTAHPYKLKVLATLRGNREYEKELHKRFLKFRLEGEWFEPHPELVAFIAVIKD